ncbi:MAG: MarR family transcriptional regulator [Pirellulales bacterium]
MLQYDFEESVGYWVVYTAHLFQRALNEELAPHGITYRQWQVLAWLALEGCLTQAQLAERMDIEPATLVSVLGRMERDGWITREECPGDKRKRLIRPTPRAKPAWEESVACARRVRARATQGFTPEQMATVKQLLAAMRENLSAEVLTTEAN